MKIALKRLLEKVESKMGKTITELSDFEKLSAYFSKRQITLRPTTLKRTWAALQTKDKPSKDALDKLALFVGFQSWQDFVETLYGETDGQINYEDSSAKRNANKKV